MGSLLDFSENTALGAIRMMVENSFTNLSIEKRHATLMISDSPLSNAKTTRVELLCKDTKPLIFDDPRENYSPPQKLKDKGSASKSLPNNTSPSSSSTEPSDLEKR